MKKILSILLVLCLFSGIITFTVAADEENFIPENNATFESGTPTWTTVGGGAVKVANNPTGEGKVLCYSNNPDRSYASPQIDIRPYVLDNVTEETTVYGSFDIFTKNDDIANALIRIRTKTSEGFSLCAELGEAFCMLGKANAYAGEWTRVTFSFEVTEMDLSSNEPWNICFDNLNGSTLEAIYIDNFYVGFEEDCPYDENQMDIEIEGPANNGENLNFVQESNSTFENGTTSWSALAKGKISVVDNPMGEGKVLCYSDLDTSVTYASPVFDIRSAVQKNVDEECTIYGSMDIFCEQAFVGLIRIRTNTPEGFSLCANDDVNYCSLGAVSVAAGEWSTVTFSFEVFEEDLESSEPWKLCFDGIYQNQNSELSNNSIIYIDNVYIGTVHPDELSPSEDVEIPEKTPVTRFEQTLVGTIRWDAFTESTPDGMDPASQVARVLSPAKYHGQAPFFSVVNEDNTIAFPKYTVETWEKEAEYAVAGGLDYFAYLWYETTDPMSQPRKYHLLSEKKDIIKYSCILERIRSDKSMQELYEAMKDSCYLRVDGRPVVFLYEVKSSNWDAKSIEKLRKDAAKAGITESLYIVGMLVTDDLNVFATNVQKGIDGISWYSLNAQATAEPFEKIAKRTEEATTKMGALALAYNVDIIPAIQTGRDTRARIETGVTWVDGDPNATNDSDKPYKNLYSLEPTMEELENHMVNIITYANTMVNSKTNMVLSYGWNEHEEGGWLCPTLAVDENGNPIYNEDGTIKANTERLDALARAKERAFTAAPEATPDTEGTVETTPTTTPPSGESDIIVPSPVPEGDTNKFDWLPIVIACGAAVIIIGAAVTIIVAKKKKK